MSKLRSSSPSAPSPSHPEARQRTYSAEDLSSGRRPSWTPSIQEATPEDTGHSQSRRRPRHHDENSPLSSQDWGGSIPSLLKAQRPSFSPSLSETFHRARKPRLDPQDSPEASKPPIGINAGLPESPEEGKGFRSSWEINVKDLVGDAVGNMSISPASRDIVLAARRGLFIIDLDSPLSIPRFLPQGGTWDVADVQWNPHPSHAQYIVSTSSERLLIWNLRLGGKTSIEHILRSHYRAVTDINWHTSECDVVSSTGIDSWIWSWDLREPRKPIFGLSAFKAGGTQVKWNRKDGNLIASANANEVLIWDRRKGSLPVKQIRAHISKIYGIDWSRRCREEIVTCSLDKTIKTWNINATDDEGAPQPTSCIRTTYPVWRARNLPFGEGILSLPQRGETTLEMFTKSETQTLVETFEGHSDVVKEFVWRKYYQGDDFQLITWSKDRTLRFWPIDAEVMQKVGHTPEIVRGRSKVTRGEMESVDTFALAPAYEDKGCLPLLSAPIGNRGILAEVRAPQPPLSALPFPPNTLGAQIPGHGTLTYHSTSDAENPEVTPTMTNTKPISMISVSVAATNRSTGGTMSKGGTGPKSVAQMDQLAWLASVKVSGKRGSSSGGNSNGGSGAPSRLGSRSRPPAGAVEIADDGTRLERSQSEVGISGRQRSGSLSRGVEDKKEAESGQTLQDEITSVLAKFSASKIKLEKHDLSKKHDGHDSEGFDSGSSSDEDLPRGKKAKEITVSLLRNNKNLAEPRTSQGAFGPNGELVCVFRAPPRIVRNVLRGLVTDAAAKVADEGPQTPAQEVQKTSYFQSPALVSDAVRRLGLAAMDRVVEPIDPRQPETGREILRAMTNLLTMPHQKNRRNSDLNHVGNQPKNYALDTQKEKRSRLYLISTRNLAGADQKVAIGYVFKAGSLADVCERNAETARSHGRYDHERVFRTLKTLFPTVRKDDSQFSFDALGAQIVIRLYEEIAKEKDIQMLAMLAVVVLQTQHGSVVQPNLGRKKSNTPTTAVPGRTGGVDYFSLTKASNFSSPISPAWPHMPSPIPPPLAPSLSSSNSSRGSWSGLFNTGNVRQFMNDVQYSFKEGLTTPTEVPLSTPDVHYFASKSAERLQRAPDSPRPQSNRRRARKDSSLYSPTVVSKSWNEGATHSLRPLTTSFSSAGYKRPSLRFVDSNPFIHEKHVVVFHAPVNEEPETPLFDAKLIEQFKLHVYAYAELLSKWQMFHQRLELLNAVGGHGTHLSILRRTLSHACVHHLSVACQRPFADMS
ncbi:hypothetical protein NLJ89_g245 [Agrocybe chaxingu]|uniref:Uncharacterized protein n=1 Tax=Agrocybe chaxingu TaxID=84603 RepID=A0A9W8N2A1_9AGAR|nr:hypothetical protein NLJ89_g245 [Agrocybe chaxingu]